MQFIDRERPLEPRSTGEDPEIWQKHHKGFCFEFLMMNEKEGAL